MFRRKRNHTDSLNDINHFYYDRVSDECYIDAYFTIDKTVTFLNFITMISEFFLISVSRYISDDPHLFLGNSIPRDLYITININTTHHLVLLGIAYYVGQVCFQQNLNLKQFNSNKIVEIGNSLSCSYLYKEFFMIGYKDCKAYTEYYNKTRCIELMNSTKKKFNKEFFEYLKELSMNDLTADIKKIIFNFL